MPTLVLINGAPGSGKSTIAAALANRCPMALSVDIDEMKHNLGHWHEDPIAAGHHARRLALAMMGQHLTDGHSVFLGQYLARTTFIEDLDELAKRLGVVFHEVLLTLTPAELSRRLRQRQEYPTRTEHAINNNLVAPDDADELVASLSAIPALRPRTLCVPAHGSLDEVTERVANALDSRG